MSSDDRKLPMNGPSVPKTPTHPSLIPDHPGLVAAKPEDYGTVFGFTHATASTASRPQPLDPWEAAVYEADWREKALSVLQAVFLHASYGGPRNYAFCVFG